MKKEILELTNTYQKAPCLAVVLVGDNSSSVTYVKMKERKAKDIGIKVLHHHLSAESTTKEVLDLIDELNNNPEVNGIIIQHPLPKQVDENQCFRRLSLEKDVDGLNPTNLGLLTIKENTFFSATPKGIVDLLHFYNFKLDGLHAVVVGRSQILGKPISLMLLNENATVTICHSRTVNLNKILKTADIIVAALGKAKFIEAKSVKPGAILIDAGYNEGNVGDIDLEKAIFKAIAYTPVPGGIGPTTIISLLSQTILAFKNQVKGNF
jgi:methylenetetrahydrofolate dehydrogenase (NADP+)/methenyltetrahydrofolate cyclohydrolase